MVDVGADDVGEAETDAVVVRVADDVAGAVVAVVVVVADVVVGVVVGVDSGIVVDVVELMRIAVELVVTDLERALLFVAAAAAGVAEVDVDACYYAIDRIVRNQAWRHRDQLKTHSKSYPHCACDDEPRC